MMLLRSAVCGIGLLGWWAARKGLSFAHAATIEVPDVYFQENNFMEIDLDLINAWADDYCESTTRPTTEEFFYSVVPLRAANSACISTDVDDLQRFFGASYVAGYLNGVFFRDTWRDVRDDDSDDDSRNDRCGPRDNDEEGEEGRRKSRDRKASAYSIPPTSDELRDLYAQHLLRFAAPKEYDLRLETYNLMDSRVDELLFPVITHVGENFFLDVGINGTDDVILLHAQLLFPPYTLLYGYNWGAYDTISSNRPPGGKRRTLRIHEKPFNISVDFFETSSLEEFFFVIDDIKDPQGTQWNSVNRTVEIFFPVGEEVGRKHWEKILEKLDRDRDDDSRDDDDIRLDPPIYNILYDTAVVNLLNNDLLLLSAIDAYGNENVESGQCSLFTGANFLTWALSNTMGLYSDLPEGTAPLLNCSDDRLSNFQEQITPAQPAVVLAEAAGE